MKRCKLDDKFSNCLCDPPFCTAWRTSVRHAAVQDDKRIERTITDRKRGYMDNPFLTLGLFQYG